MNLIVDSIPSVALVAKHCQELFEERGKQCVTIVDAKRIRSIRQNSLLWKWYGEISKDTGYTPDELHELYKEKFLIRIFARDDESYAEMAMAIKKVEKDNPEAYQVIRQKVIRMTSSTDCSVAQMTEFLNSIKVHAQGELGIALTQPEHRGLI